MAGVEELPVEGAGVEEEGHPEVTLQGTQRDADGDLYDSHEERKVCQLEVHVQEAWV